MESTQERVVSRKLGEEETARGALPQGTGELRGTGSCWIWA